MTYDEYLKKTAVLDYLNTLADMGIEYEVDNNVSYPGLVVVTQHNGFRTIKTYWHDGAMVSKEYI